MGTPPIFLAGTQGEWIEKWSFSLCCFCAPPCCGARQGEEGCQSPPLCFAQQNIGEVARSDGGVERLFICSFFSAARRTNQEAPPRLSGFWVCRRSRRRGLRNSLRSDSPRPFSSVFLATSPPDKGGDLIRAFDGLESFC